MNKKRVCAVYCVFLAAMLVLCLRFYTIAKNGSKASTALAGQYTRRIDIAKRSGFVFDRDGRLMSMRPDGFLLFVNPAATKYENMQHAALLLAEACGKEQSYFYEKLFAGDPFVAVSKKPVDTDYCKSFIKYAEDNSSFACHLLGYRNSDGKGMAGVLLSYDKFLTDEQNTAAHVSAVYQSDAAGRVLPYTLPQIFDYGYSEKNGIYLTVDMTVQYAVEKICDSNMDMGAVVVQDISTRQLVAVVSRPLYNPGNISAYLSSNRGELLNRAFLAYTPGSVFKTVVAATALDSGLFETDRSHKCEGFIKVSDKTIRCHEHAGHGELDMCGAFAASCNPYFIDLGLSVGTEQIVTMAQRMGAGMFSSFNLVKTAKGTLPKENLNEPITTANTSVGQGELLLTPVEVCSIISSCVTGYFKKPSLVIKLTDNGQDHVYSINDVGTRVLNDNTVYQLRRMFEQCVSDGTGYRAFSDIVTVAGKTATAQSGQIKNGKEVIHQWFAGYFPAEEPRYAVCVLCDGNGDKNANPAAIFKKIAETVYGIES